MSKTKFRLASGQVLRREGRRVRQDGENSLRDRFLALAEDPQPAYLEQTAQQLRRVDNPTIYRASHRLSRAATALRLGHFRTAEAEFQAAWSQLQLLRSRAAKLQAAVRVATRAVKKSNESLELDLGSSAGDSLTGDDVHTDSAGGEQKREGDDPTYGVQGNGKGK